MMQAENYVMLHEGGNKAQAEHLAENMSVWKGQDWKAGATVFGFEDGSAVWTCGPEFRQATSDEVAEFR